MEKLSKEQQTKAGIARAMLNNNMVYFKGFSISCYNQSALNYEVVYVSYGAYTKGSGLGKGAKVVGEVVQDQPAVWERGVSHGKTYRAQAILRPGEGKEELIFP